MAWQYDPHGPQGLPRPHFAPQPPRVELEIRGGRARNLVRAIDGPVYMIGSARDCDLVLGDPAFPEVHSYLYVRSDGVSLRHLGEGPQVAVSDTPVQSVRLRDGDVIRTGPFEFQIHIDWPHGAPRYDDHDEIESTAQDIVDDLPAKKEARSHLRLALPTDETAQHLLEVETLLADVREAYGIPPRPLRLYTGPEDGDLQPALALAPSRRESA